MLIDSSWDNIRAALMDGLNTYYGKPVSEHADRHLDLVGIGQLLALSPRSELNALSTMRYHAEFGGGNLFVLNPSDEEDSTEKRKYSMQKGTKILFDEDVNYARLSKMMVDGAEIRCTSITEKFDISDYNKKYYSRSIPLFAFNPKGRIYPFIAGDQPNAGPGWTIMALVLKEEEEQEQMINQSDSP